jgi:PKD repeat protein
MKLNNYMKQKLKGALLFISLGLSSASAFAQMSGSYTIDPANTGAATATMFKNWNSFVKSIYNMSTTVNPRTDGGPIVTGLDTVTGPVTVTVVSTNVTAEAIALTLPSIKGVSSTNKIVIDGNNQTFNYNAAYAPFQFTGADYVTIKNLTIINASTTPGGFWFNNQSDYNTVSGCTVNFSALASASTGAYYLSMSTSVSSPTSSGSAATGTTGQPGSYNTFSSNTFLTSSVNSPGPYYAVSLNGNSANYSTVAQNNTFTANKIQNFYNYAIYEYYTNGNSITSNDISRVNTAVGGSTQLLGIYSFYSYSTTRASEISKNTIHDLPFSGATLLTTNLASFYLTYQYYTYGNATYRAQCVGNSFYNIYSTTGSSYGNYVYYPQYLDIKANTIDNIQSSGTAATMYMWYVYYPTYTVIDGNNITNSVGNYYWYSWYVYYPSYVDVLNNVCDNIKQNYTSGYLYNFYIYYPTGLRCNANTVNNNYCGYYMYSFYIYYGSVGTYTWNEFQDNVITKNASVSYNYSAYIYYYNGTNNFKVNRNYVVGNTCSGGTGYHYFYLYYLSNYEVIGNVVAGNYANSQYIYVYSGLSGTFTAEIRNNTFMANTSTAPTPGSSYIYCYLYLYYHTVMFTGNIIDLKGTGTQYYRYLYMYLAYASPGVLKEFNDNTYSLNNLFTYPYWYFNGTNYTDWAGFSGSGLQGSRDNGDNPLFVDIANNDWRAGAWTVQNNVAYLAKNDVDCKKTSRNRIAHDRGGLETNTDLQAISTNFTVPADVCAGYTTGATWIILKSLYPYDKARNFNVSYAVNKGPKISAKVTKQLANGDTVKVFFPTPLVLNASGPARIAIFVDLPDDNNSNDSFIFNTTVKPAPGGGVMTFTTSPTWAYYQPAKNNDVTVLGQPVEYSVNSPRIYSNKDYLGNGGGNNWAASVVAKCKYGKSVTGATITPPTATSDLLVKFVTTDKTLEDSTITLYLIVNDKGNGCDTIIKRDVLIYPTIVPNFTKPKQACVGESILFENKSTVTSGNMEFKWDFGTGKVSDNTDAPDPVFVYKTPGTYKVMMLAKTLPYGFPSKDSVTFQVNPVPTASFSKKNACEGYNLSFTNQTTPSNATVSWDFGDNKGVSTSNNPTYKYASKGSYLVTMTADLAGCLSTAVQRVYQFEKPKAAYKVVSGDCDNKDFVFANNSSIGSGLIGSYWNFDDNSVSTDMAPKHLFGSSGKKNVKLVITSEFGCKDSVTNIVVVKESPKVRFINGPACSLKPTDFTNTTSAVANAIASYQWVFSDGTSTKAESPSHSWGSLGPKTATLTISLDNGCTSSATKSLEVLIQPKAYFSAADVCAGQPIVFNNSTSWAQGDISYSWDFSDNTSSTESDPLHTYNVNATTTYNVTLKAKIAGGCLDSFTRQITINEGPKTCDFQATPDYAFGYYGMKFEPMNASGATGAQGTVTYTWVIENGGKQNGPTAQFNFLKDGSYQVTMYAVTKSTGCECSATKTVLMNRASAKSLATSGVAVYPNPAIGSFNVAMTESFGSAVSIVVTNMSGAAVKSINVMNNGLVNVDTRDLSEGVYMVRVQSGSRIATEKITITK